MEAGKIIAGLVPFVLFGFLAQGMGVFWAGVTSAAVAVVVALLDLRGGLKILPVAGVVILGLLALAGLVTGPDAQGFLAVHARGAATALLGLYVLATSAFAPFTAQFARTHVPREKWHSPSFLSINRKLSAVWGAAILFIGLCNLVASSLQAADLEVHPIVLVLIDWGLPIAAIILTVRYTKTAVGKRAEAESPSPETAG